MTTKAQYYAVRWGDAKIAGENDEHDESRPNMDVEVRIASGKYSGVALTQAKNACRNCYGMISANMWVKPLGSTVDVIRSYKKRVAALTDPEGWTRMGRNPKHPHGTWVGT